MPPPIAPQQGPPPNAQSVHPSEPPRRSQPQLRPVRVEEIVETEVIKAKPATPIRSVVSMMAKEGVGSVVVVEDDEPIGILTDRKIALAIESTPNIAEKSAEAFLSGTLVTGTTDMSVFDGLRQLEGAGVRRLPIVDDDGKLAGIITLDDILVLLGTELGNVTSIVKTQSPRL